MNDTVNKDQILIVKLTSGDIVVAKSGGVDEDSEGIILVDPLVLTSTSGYILLTDFCPFLTSYIDKPSVIINPNTMVYVEEVGAQLADYYHTSRNYRDLIRGDMTDIITKSQDLIQKTMDELIAERKLDTPEVTITEPAQGDSGDESPITDHVDSNPEKVIDFSKILNDALKKKDSNN